MTGPLRVGVVVPARDEATLLPACLDGLRAAALTVAGRVRVRVLVVLDTCADTSAAVVRDAGAESLAVMAGCVGAARAAGCSRLLDGPDPPRWLACTDADSVVPPDWFLAHLAARTAGCQALAGTVRVGAWEDRSAGVRSRYEAGYAGHGGGDEAGHRHVHGANLGVDAAAYRRCGGFAPLSSGEDVALVAALERDGARIHRSRAVPVLTSARRRARTAGGFADHLTALESAPLSAVE